MRFSTALATGLLACLMYGPVIAAEPEFSRPPYAGAYQPQGVDERGMWSEIDEMERGFRDTPYVLKDEELTAYVRDILCRTVGDDRCNASRIYIVKNAVCNASMYPNGMMLVHTGLLARVGSESELATVLGHEFAHFEKRHSLARFLAQRKANDFINWISLAGFVTNVDTRSTVQNIQIAAISYGRANESEADALAAQYLRASPYRLSASPFWRRSIAEADASRRDRGLRRLRHLPSLLDSHPTNEQRFVYFAKQEAEAGERGTLGVDTYRERIAPYLGAIFEPLIKGNDFGGADYVLTWRGDTLGWDGRMLTLRAELYRLRANPRDLVTARQFFEKATAYPDAPAESWRGLGLTAVRLGDVTPGRAALAEYLRRQPDAKDAAAIKLLLEN